MRVLVPLAFVCVLVLPLAHTPAGAASACDTGAAEPAAGDASCARAWFDANLHINEIQTVGTAESYKLRPSDSMLSLIRMGSSDDAKALDFAEPPIAEQLKMGARSLTFDVAYDPKGGLYKIPAGASMAGELIPDDYIAAMATPGFKVIHILDIDFNSNCVTLVSCLQAVASWSRANKDHLPIVIALKSNDDRTPMPGATRPVTFDGAVFDALDAEIRTVFQPGDLITPDQVQGTHVSLREAVLAHDWPKLAAARGKILFVLDDTPQKTALYRGKRASLEGRAMFIVTDDKSPAAAFVTVENPAKQASAIAADVKAGFMVHTFADADTKEARAGSTQRRDQAFASGAQIVSTDFLVADAHIGKYAVRLPGNRVAQCSAPVAPQHCQGRDVESGAVPAAAP
ncbi:MAG TPA: Ca2+-dependent phosphoinositide-specific phospholipase C [Rhizomicrobium sp.]|nr:Ca2+-dependent phosphoinositide-specific phospholipase C [Rhizomicrobium sp.]